MSTVSARYAPRSSFVIATGGLFVAQVRSLTQFCPPFIAGEADKSACVQLLKAVF